MTPSDPSNCPKCGSEIPREAPGGLCPKCVLEGAAATPSLTGTTGKAAPPPGVEEIAPHFPDLEVLELIGAGGMGAVYKARQPQLDRMVALKILSHDLSADPSFTERFNREAKVLARLSHPNIVGVHDYGTAGPYCYLMMEYVDGVNLRQAMQAGRFTPAESLAMVEEICAALKFAHEEGILHRDIKPENVLIDSKGRVKIADFGIAKLVGDDPQADVTLTLRGSVLGSPHYMAPEQIETPGDVDQRADIYSLGVVFYELLTGELPLGRFALPSEKAVMDARIDQIVLRTLEKERQARFQSADEMMTQVGAVTQSPGAAVHRPAAASTDHSGNARFSMASAIFTGISLVLLIFAMIFANADILPRKLAYLVSMLVLGLSGCLGIVGLILGSAALRKIRRSGGQKGGLGSAVFGVVTWLVLLMGIIGTTLLRIPMSGDPEIPRASIGVFLALLIIGVPQIIGAFVLVRGLRRWAGGVPTEDGARRHPGLSRPIVGVIGLIILGPVIAQVAARVLPPSGRPHPIEEAMREMRMDQERIRLSLKESYNQQTLEWYRGNPEVLLPVKIDPSIQATFRLVIIDAEGNPKHAEMGSIYGQGDFGETIRTVLKIGSSGPKGEGLDRERGFTGLIDHTGERDTIYGEEDFSKWTFETPLPPELNLKSPGEYFTIQIATHSDEIDSVGDQFTSTLTLEVRTSEL